MFHKTVTATAGNLVNGDEISVDITGGDKTEVGTYTATATGLTGGKTENYKLPDDDAKRTFTYSIGKGKLKDKELTMSVYKCVPKTYTYDFSKELPVLADGLTFGNIQYTGTLSDTYDENWISKGNVVLNGSELSITTYDWDKGEQILEYVVTVKSDNYEDFTMTLKVNAKDKTVVNLPKSDVTITGRPYGSNGVNKPDVRNVPADARLISTVYTNKTTGEVITPTGMTDAGAYTVTVRYESDDTVYIGATDFNINPRHLFDEDIEVPIGVTPDKTYDGTTASDLTELGIAEDRLVTKENGALRVVGTAEYAGSNAGATKLVFTTDGTMRLSGPDSRAKTGNYGISGSKLTKELTANILQRELAFTVDSVSMICGSSTADVHVTFTSVEDNSKSGLVSGETLEQGVDYDVTATFNRTDVGTDNNVTVAVTLKDTGKARNYTLAGKSTITGVTGTIKAKPTPVLEGNVTLSLAEFTYGEPLSKIEITGTMKDPNTGEEVPGTFAWTDSTFMPNAGSYEAEWTFTPNAPEYAVATGEVTIVVHKATSTGEPKYTKVTTGGKTLNDAALTIEGSTLNPNTGKLEWVDDNGNVLTNDTKVEANKTYKWRFTPADGNYTTLTGTIKLYSKSTGGGGGGTTRYTVSFDTNGGNKISSERIKRNGTLTEPTAPTKEGFDFAGWYTDKGLKTKYDFSAKVTKNITLYAAWTEKDNSADQIILTIGEKSAQVFGQTKTNDVAPKIVNDRTMLPARFVAENLGADVSWDGEKELVTIKGKNLKTSEDITILIYIGSDIAYVNGKEIKLDSAAFIENDRTYTPVRFISEELGASVEWLEKDLRVVITKTLPSEK